MRDAGEENSAGEEWNGIRDQQLHFRSHSRDRALSPPADAHPGHLSERSGKAGSGVDIADADEVVGNVGRKSLKWGG